MPSAAPLRKFYEEGFIKKTVKGLVKKIGILALITYFLYFVLILLFIWYIMMVRKIL